MQAHPRSTRAQKTRHPGIYRFHARTCAYLRGWRCDCAANYQATAYVGRERKLVRKHFPTLAAARTWREDANQAIRAGTFRAPSRVTVGEALHGYVAGMQDGSILDRSGHRYKPATCRRYEAAVRLHLTPAIGHFKLSELPRSAIQDFADRQRAVGAAPSSVHNVLDPLRAVYRRALQRDEATVDPTQRLALPAVRATRDRIVDPAGAEGLIDALPETERALWATALYTGARRGELRELRWSDVDLDAGTIRIERARDDGGAVIATKTAAGRRVVPIVPRLRRRLAAHKLATGRSGDDLVFGRTPAAPFVPSTVRSRARRAWDAAGLEPLGLHEGRHTCASLLIDAGVNDKALSAIMGHASVTITKDRYGHLMPDGVAEAGRLLNARLERA